MLLMQILVVNLKNYSRLWNFLNSYPSPRYLSGISSVSSLNLLCSMLKGMERCEVVHPFLFASIHGLAG